MTLLWASLIVVAATAAGIAAMLFVRRRAPEGSYFADGDRAAGVFGVLATGFAILVPNFICDCCKAPYLSNPVPRYSLLVNTRCPSVSRDSFTTRCLTPLAR